MWVLCSDGWGEDALFSVIDSGRGIPADRLESVFERFRQVDASDAREKGGTGLGLPIARGIVDQHGGRMWAQSTEGEGSAFRFALPLSGNSELCRDDNRGLALNRSATDVALLRQRLGGGV